MYVDAQKLVNGYKGMTDARKELEGKVATWRSNLDTLRSEVELVMKDYEAKRSSLSERERKLTEELIKTKQEQFVNYQQVINEKIQSADQELSSKVLGKVNDYIKRYGQQKGYKIIMAATKYGNIVYAAESTDITDEVLEGLNAEYSH